MSRFYNTRSRGLQVHTDRQFEEKFKGGIKMVKANNKDRQNDKQMNADLIFVVVALTAMSPPDSQLTS